MSPSEIAIAWRRAAALQLCNSQPAVLGGDQASGKFTNQGRVARAPKAVGASQLKPANEQ